MDNKKIFASFANNLLERLERAYSDEIFNIFNDMPHPVVMFNNTEALKRAQMYVHHTNRIFSKQFANLIVTLFTELGNQSSAAKDSKGNCVFNRCLKTRFHFINLEQIAGFPHVAWFKPSAWPRQIQPNDIKDVYMVMIKTDVEGKKYMQTINDAASGTSYSFLSLEDFMLNYFGQDCYDHLIDTFDLIEQRSATFEWFELSKTCNEATIHEFKDSVSSLLQSTDYCRLLNSTGTTIDKHTYCTIYSAFINNKRYLSLLGESDFAKSFYTSEWLYKMNRRDDKLDKTYIITGYIKSVEQLLSSIVQSQPDDYKIAIMNKDGFKEVPANSSESLSATLGNMVYFINSFENQSIFQGGITRKTIRAISRIMQEWIKHERNGLFHKENLADLTRVDQIRDCTIIIYFLLLGSIKNDMAVR
jgi:hypothetical protein